ncbi:MAG: secretin N-terminal domain-containing protein, partial [Gammaproteobacteria bacterium]
MKLFSLLMRSVPLLLLFGSQAATADYPIEVIQLKSRPLEEILPVIRPLIGADGTATGMGNSLVLKAAPAQVREIRKLLLEIDRPPRRLLITVSKQGDSARGSSGYSAGADIRTGDGQISINSPGRAVDDTRVRLRIHDSSDQRTRMSGQQVQALEGRSAFIASGSRIPVQDVERYHVNGHLHERQVTRMQDASSGFYVVPRLNGEYVTLEINQRDDRPGMRRGVISTQSTDTVVRGRLGEWISLGGVNTTSNSRQGGLGRSQASQESVVQQIEVMVECLDCAGD